MHGLDEEVRNCILDQIGTGNVEAPELIAMDPTLIGILGLEYALSVAPSTFYRKCAIEVAMDLMEATVVEECCFDYPQELVWAISDRGNAGYAPIATSLASVYRSDSYLLNWIVQCVSKVGDDQQLDEVLAIAQATLSDSGVGGT
jgi:hypothetical protein